MHCHHVVPAMSTRRLLWAGALAGGLTGALTLAGGAAQAQERYPSRTIQMIVGYNPGAQDNILRPFSDKLAEHFKQTVLIVYKPGAGGALGASFTAKAKPDGYTILIASAGPVILNPLSKPELDYKLNDFLPIARLASLPLAVAVKSDSPLRSVKDIVELARKRPAAVTYSTAGPFSTPHVLMQLFERASKTRLSHIPYNGSAPAIVALLGGHVEMAAAPVYGFDAHARAGNVRMLGVGTTKRAKEAPDVPTFSEGGVPVIFSTWHGLFAPRGTPADITNAFFGALKAVVEREPAEFEKKMQSLGVSLDLAGPEEFGRAVAQETEAMREIVPAMAAAAK